MENKSVSKSMLLRLPVYLDYLKSLPADKQNISATAIAFALSTGEVQVRKDLANVSGGGKPKIGYSVNELISDIEGYLGFDSVNNAVLVGAGKLGIALLCYNGFLNYGLNISAAFDCDKNLFGRIENSKPVLSIESFPEVCEKLKPKLGIITVPAENAQSICDLMVNNNIKAIMNFSPTHLSAPDDVIIENENIATSLALLARHLK